MSNTTKIILFAIILALLFWPSGGKLFPPKVNADDYIFGPDSLAVASLMTMVESNGEPSPAPDNLVADKCKCTNGKISFDGGTSWTECPCRTQGAVCGFKDCPCAKLAPKSELDNTVVIDNSVVENKDHFPRTVIITQVKSCLHCRVLDKNVLSILRNDAHKKSGWKVGTTSENNVQILDLDDENSWAEIERLKFEVDSLPTLYYLQRDGSYKSYVGSMTYKQYIEWTKSNSKKSNLLYLRRSNQRWSLNGSTRPSRNSLISHLKSEHGIEWDLNKLSYEELLAIHDDDHVGKLGKLE